MKYEQQKKIWYDQILSGRSRGEVELEFEGCMLLVCTDSYMINSGDLYFTPGRNTGAKLLLCQWHNKLSCVVFPEGNEYPFDTWECFKVLAIDGEPSK